MAKAVKTKVQVSERALMQRINRKLKPEGELLRTARGTYDSGRWHPNSNLGWHYTIDVQLNCVVSAFIDLEAYGRELGVLQQWEELAE